MKHASNGRLLKRRSTRYVSEITAIATEFGNSAKIIVPRSWLIGTSVCPVLAGVFMQPNQTVIPLIGSFPGPQSYNLIFLTAALMSILSIVLVGTMIGRRAKPKIVMK
jgi:hypothetical protein